VKEGQFDISYVGMKSNEFEENRFTCGNIGVRDHIEPSSTGTETVVNTFADLLYIIFIILCNFTSCSI